MAAGDKLFLCTCGKSAKQPFCDGSHRAVNAETGSTFAPIKVEATEAKDVW